MQIRIYKIHKSIIPPSEFELPNFSVLTGKNGSGKTHLLEAIADPTKSKVYLNEKLVTNIRYIGFNALNPNIQETFDPLSISHYIKNAWNYYNNARQSYLVNQATNYDINTFLGYISDENTKIFVKIIIKETKKTLLQLNEDDFNNNFDISLIQQNDFFTSQFSLIFKNYQKIQEENRINEYYEHKRYPTLKPSISEKDFEIKYGIPPWDFVNNILAEMNIPYKVNSPIGTHINSSFNFKLIDREKGFEISSNDLSTGEKTLMSLALGIYNSGSNLVKPEVLLLDEPDAGLHPSMSKKMIEVLNKNIVVDSKIPTIISTHSPTTIIASEGISIYQMVRGHSTPIKISTQQAIEILSSDIPFLKISNDKRRQVFVESKYDVIFYELLTNILVRLEPLSSEPIFLPARTSNGSNCSDVISIVSNLYKNGNEQVYGIVDWDTTNKTEERVIVLGENDRYSIENYLLDPFLLGLFFIRERKLTFPEFGLTNYSSYSDAGRLTNIEAQKIADYILQNLGFDSTDIEKSHLYNGWTLNISNKFKKHQGHNIENIYKSTFPFLKAYQREEALKKEIIEKVINDYPQYAPKQLFETIQRIK